MDPLGPPTITIYMFLYYALHFKFRSRACGSKSDMHPIMGGITKYNPIVFYKIT